METRIILSERDFKQFVDDIRRGGKPTTYLRETMKMKPKQIEQVRYPESASITVVPLDER